MIENDEVALNLIDAALGLDRQFSQKELGTTAFPVREPPPRWGAHLDRVARVDQLLREGGAAWRVGPNGMALQRRVSEAATQAMDGAVAAADRAGGSAGGHLRTAWQEAYGRPPDATKAYSEAIKAVEAASIPVVTPNDTLATLGKVLGELRRGAKPYRFAIAPGDLGAVIQLMTTLWEGQTDRHGRPGNPVPVTQDAAEAAVAAAVTLVHWFTTGAVKAS